MAGREDIRARDGFLKLDTEEVRRSGARVDVDIPPGLLSRWLEDCEYRVSPVWAAVSLEATPCGDGILVSGKARARIEAECAVCLGEARMEIDADIKCFLLPLPPGGAPETEGDLTPEDLEREWFEGDVAVLDGIVRDALVLELPMTPRCGDSCPGMALAAEDPDERPGIDPRLAPLASIKLAKE